MRLSRLSVILPPYCTSDTMYWNVGQLFQGVIVEWNGRSALVDFIRENELCSGGDPNDILQVCCLRRPHLMGPLYRCFSKKRMHAVRSPLLYS